MPQITIIEEDEDGGFDISDDTPPPPEHVPAAKRAAGPVAAPDADFYAAKTFGGARSGYVFKTGPSGTGYYREEPGAGKSAERSSQPPPKPSPVPAPQSVDVKLSLLHRVGVARPSVVEVVVPVPAHLTSAGEVTAELAAESSRLVLSSKAWAGRCEVPLLHAVHPGQAQGWLHQGELTLRFPISA